MPDNPDTAPDDAAAAPSEKPARFRLAFGGMLLVLGLASLDQNIVGTALPRIVSELGGLAHISWVVTAFLIASTATTPLYGKLSDMYGRRAMIFTSVLVFLAGSMLCGQARSMGELIGFRAVQGLGAGGLITLVQATIGDLVAPRERGRYQGLFAGVFALGSVAGPLVGGFITDALSWRWIFYVNLPVGGAALALIATALPRTARRAQRRIDYAGAVLLTGATSTAMLALTWGGTTYPWGSTVILGLVAGAVALTIAFLLRERVAAEPILPLHLFANSTFSIATGTMALTFTAMFSVSVFLPLFFQLVLGASPSQAGLMTAPLMGGLVCSSFLGGRVVSRTGHYRPLPIAGLAIASLAYFVLTWAALSDLPTVLIEGVLVVLGAGLGLVMPNLTVAVQNAVDRNELGVATAASGFVRSLGGSFGVALGGAIMTAMLHRLLPGGGAGGQSHFDEGLDQIAALAPAERLLVVEAYRHAIAYAFLAGAVMAGVAFLLATRLPATRLGDRPIQKG